SPWPLSVCISLPAFRSHSLSVRSSLPETASFPFADSDTLVTIPSWPRKVNRTWPVLASQSLSVLSALPLRRRLPSLLRAIHVMPSPCPAKVRNSSPCGDQSLSVLSALAEMTLPLPSTARAWMGPLCPPQDRTISPSSRFQSVKGLAP